MREGVARLGGADLTIADVFVLALVLVRVDGTVCRNDEKYQNDDRGSDETGRQAGRGVETNSTRVKRSK